MNTTNTPVPNPMVGAVLYDDGEINFEFRGETGEAHEYSFTNPALLEDIAVLLNRAAVASKRIQTGVRTFEELAPQFGGTVGDDGDDSTVTYQDLERPTPEERGVAPAAQASQLTLPFQDPEIHIAPPEHQEHTDIGTGICPSCGQRPRPTGQCGCS